MIGCLVIHGYTGGPHELEPLVAYLKKETDFIFNVPTLPGHGKELALEGSTFKKWINFAEEALKTLQEKCQTIYIIGFSMGGMIASYLAGKYDVNKLVLLAPAGKFISVKQISLDIGEVIIDSLKGELDDNKLYTRYSKKIGAVPFKANIEFIKLVRHTRKYLGQITCPVFIAQGKQDGIVPAKTIHYLDKEIASEEKEVVLFDQSDHLICWGDDKDILNNMVRLFLANKEAVM